MTSFGEAVEPRYYESYHDAFEAQDFGGTFGTILNRMQESVRGREAIDFWNPGRLVVGSLEYKIAFQGQVPNLPDLVTNTSDLAIDIHAGKLTEETLETYVELASGYDGLLDHQLTHERDHVSAKSANPKFSKAAAEALDAYVEDTSMLLIALGRGGITPGILTYIHYARLGRDRNLAFYPVRFARCSQSDDEPQVTEEEAAHLRSEANDKANVVVFDEDASTGRTQLYATRFFSGLLDREVIPLANRGSDTSEEVPLIGMPAFARTKDLTKR